MNFTCQTAFRLGIYKTKMPTLSLNFISSIINAAALCLILFSSSVHELKRRDDGQRGGS